MITASFRVAEPNTPGNPSSLYAVVRTLLGLPGSDGPESEIVEWCPSAGMAQDAAHRVEAQFEAEAEWAAVNEAQRVDEEMYGPNPR